MIELVIELLRTRAVYVLVVVLLGIGLYAMFVRTNLIHKIIGLTVFQAAIFLFFIEGSVRDGATAPVIDAGLGNDPAAYVNPLPHLLILTAIVVGAGTLGTALALVIRLYRAHGSLEEDVLLDVLDGRRPGGDADHGRLDDGGGDRRRPGEGGGRPDDGGAS